MAEAHVLSEGYLSGPDDDRVGSTVGFIRDGDVLIVVDPGLVPSAAATRSTVSACAGRSSDGASGRVDLEAAG